MGDKSDLTITKLMNYIHTRKKGEIGFVNTKIGGNLNVTGLIYTSKLNNGTDFTLPTTDGNAGQFLKTDGNGNLEWGSDSFGKWLDGTNSSIYNDGPVGIGKNDP